MDAEAIVMVRGGGKVTASAERGDVALVTPRGELLTRLKLTYDYALFSVTCAGERLLASDTAGHITELHVRYPLKEGAAGGAGV